MAYTVYYDTAGTVPSYDEHVAEVAALCEANPTWGNVVLGQSGQGRDIREISVSHAGDTKTMFITGGTHGLEKLGPMCVLGLLHYISANPTVFPTTKIVVVPMINPDGYVANTRKNNNTPAGRKVDINRNLAAGWGQEDAEYGSTLESSDLYMGPSPASEPESQIIEYAMRKNRPNITVDVHATGDALYYNEYTDAWTFGNTMSAALVANGFAAHLPTPRKIWIGSNRTFGYRYGALAYTYETADTAVTSDNRQEVNRFICSMISLEGITIPATYKWTDQQIMMPMV